MMEYIYFSILVVVGLLSLLAMLASVDGFFPGAFCAGAVLVLVAIPYTNHNSDIATIDFAAEIIEVETDYAKQLKSQLGLLPSIDGAILNADSPYSSIVKEISASQRRVRSAKSDVLSAKISIEKRKRFATAFVLWFF